jgi:hypothetical protein
MRYAYMTGGDGGNDEITGEYHWEVEIGSLSRNILLGHLFPICIAGDFDES